MPLGGSMPTLAYPDKAFSTHSSTRELPVEAVSLICLTRPSALTTIRVDKEPLADLTHGDAASRSLIASRMRVVYHANGALPDPPSGAPPDPWCMPKASPPAVAGPSLASVSAGAWSGSSGVGG